MTMKLNEAIQTEIFDEPYPCDGCEHARKCAVLEMSCKPFHIYVSQKGKMDPGPRTPDRAWYYRTFLRVALADKPHEKVRVRKFLGLRPGVGGSV